MPAGSPGMELWAIVPELVLAGLVLVLLPLGPLVARRSPAATTWMALVGLGGATVASLQMLSWPAQPVFLGTYAVDPFAVFFKLVALLATGFVLLATPSHFREQPHAASVPALLVLTCLGLIGLAASQDFVLIALFLQLMTVGSYVLVGLAKDDRWATEGAIKLFLFSAAANAVMLYGMSLLYGLTGALRLPELASRLPATPPLVALAALGLVLVGYGFEITLVPFHPWAPDTYQGAPTPIAGFLSVGPKAAGLAVLLRTLAVAFAPHQVAWTTILAILAAVTMTVGNLFALRQSRIKRLLAYSSIAQAGYLLVGVAAAGRDQLAVPGFLLYIAVYLLMNLGAFLATNALEQLTGTDELDRLAGLGARAPLAAATLAGCLLSLAGLPPFGGFVGKTMLFGAALGAGWSWLAVVMAVNVALSLAYYVRVIEPLYLRPAGAASFAPTPFALRLALLGLASGTLLSGIFPQPLVALAEQASAILAGQLLR